MQYHVNRLLYIKTAKLLHKNYLVRVVCCLAAVIDWGFFFQYLTVKKKSTIKTLSTRNRKSQEIAQDLGRCCRT